MSQFSQQPAWTKRIWDELESLKSRVNAVITGNAELIIGLSGSPVSGGVGLVPAHPHTGDGGGGEIVLRTYTSVSRPSPITAGAGAIIFNSTDGGLNISDGTNWLNATWSTSAEVLEWGWLVQHENPIPRRRTVIEGGSFYGEDFPVPA